MDLYVCVWGWVCWCFYVKSLQLLVICFNAFKNIVQSVS
uniref:Uncharacterized protein n=1 Tax=Anguilla anguilla TaxID=7936 RepID=A0A0E9T8N8_ANGAN